MRKIIMFASIGLLVSPLIAVAQATDTLGGVLNRILSLLNLVVPIIAALAFLYFIYGVANLITAGGDTEKQGEGRSIMIYGIIALFVIVSVWGLVNILVQTFGTTTTDIPVPLPVFKGNTGTQ